MQRKPYDSPTHHINEEYEKKKNKLNVICKGK